MSDKLKVSKVLQQGLCQNRMISSGIYSYCSKFDSCSAGCILRNSYDISIKELANFCEEHNVEIDFNE